MLISSKTIKEINLVSQQCFWINRVIDRAVSVMSTKFGLAQTSKVIHQELAHKYPILADDVNEILDMFNEGIDYLNTPENRFDYDNIVELFQTILDENIALYELTKRAINVARLEGDINVESHLLDFARTLNSYVAICITLRDKAQEMEFNLSLFDFVIPSLFDKD